MEAKNIDFFKVGEIVTRIEPAMNDFRGLRKKPIEPLTDHSYIGECLKYVGRIKDKIYFRNYSHKESFKKGRKFSVNYEIFKNGWAVADEFNFSQESFKNLNLEDIDDVSFYLNHISNMEENYKMN